MKDQSSFQPSNEPCASHLTPDDTWCMWIDSWGMRCSWATVVDERIVSRDGTDTTADEVLDWAVDLIEDETGDRFALNHNVMLATMHRIVRERDSVQLSDEIIDQISEVLEATSHAAATDELCQLDCVGFDAIVQFATLGQVVYG
ncbi:hypothetical protein [Lentzea sp. NPDC051838]|uniref:hypothetical protein n=1 Tax=Lentzea sp. NPDC051838 TaxID=3154849 RepID=UPI0034176425